MVPRVGRPAPDAQSRSTFVSDQASKLIYPERVIATHVDQRSIPFKQNSPPTVVFPFSQLVSGVDVKVFYKAGTGFPPSLFQKRVWETSLISVSKIGSLLKVVLAWSGGEACC